MPEIKDDSDICQVFKSPDIASISPQLEMHINLVFLSYIYIKTDCGIISIEKCPSYMDRGRYKVTTSSMSGLCVDSADAFPRYYFRFENLISEIQDWIEAKKITVTEIELREIKVNKKEA